MNGRKRKSKWWVSHAGDGPPRACEWPECGDEGLYRAPRSRNDLRRYRWFCLDHVRQVNAAWNYYGGMNDQEVENDVRKDSVWRRPSWRLGGGGPPFGRGSGAFEDPFGLFGSAEPAPEKWKPSTPKDKAMKVLELNPPLTASAVKARYKVLVKRHHPDANGGAKASEEMFKRIHQAYQTIMESLAPVR
jgi:DnaJ-domain-containing protein 1